MKNFNSDPHDKKDEPEKTGDTEVPKKRKKRTTKIPLPIKKTDAIVAEQDKSKKAEKESFFDTEKENNTGEKENSQAKTESTLDTEYGVEEKVLEPSSEEVEAEQQEDEYLGELVIDHSYDQETIPEVIEEETITPLEITPILGKEEIVAEDEDFREFVNVYETEEDTAKLFEVKETDEAKEAAPILDTPYETVPPSQPQEGFNPAQFQSMIDPSTRHAERTSSDFVEADKMVTEKEAHERAYRAEKRGLSRGVVSGALAGWWIGRRGKRALERESTMAIESRDETIKKLVSERDMKQNLTKNRLSVLERTQDELRNIAVRSKNEKAKLTKRVDQLFKTEKKERVSYKVPESSRPTFEAEKQPKKETEKKSEEVNVYEQILTPPEGRRFESSAWHRIEVDEKTGKAVEAPSSQYGEAFTREQQQEKLAREAATAQTASHLGMALFASDNTVMHSPVEPTNITHPRVSDDKSNVIEDVAYIGRRIADQATSPITWIAALVIVGLLFVSGVLS